MWSSRLFWRLFLSYSALTVAAAVAFAVVFQGRQREAVETEVQERLRDEAIVVQSLTEAAWESPDAPVEELRAVWQPKLEALGKQIGTRLTLIQTDGTVLADSATDARLLENHRDRPEIQLAIETGVAFKHRSSQSIHEEFEYCAVRVGSKENPRGFVRIALPWTLVE